MEMTKAGCLYEQASPGQIHTENLEKTIEVLHDSAETVSL